jgi:hypothetical protein
MRIPIVHARVQDDDVNFAVVSVKDDTISDQGNAEKLVETLQTAYQCPIVLMGEGNHQLFGRQEIVDFLGQRSPADLPWQESEVEIPDPSD